MKIAQSAIIYPNVVIGENSIIEDFCIIGCPPKSGESKPTVIGAGSHIRSHTIIYSGNQIGSNFQTGNKANIRENNVIGDHVRVGTLSTIEYSVVIGDYVCIHTQAFIPEYSVLEDNCWIGPHVVLTNAKYPLSSGVKEKLIGPVIKKGAIIGANSTILPGVIIASKTLIGAGSVVCKNTEELSVYNGNPAKFIKKLSDINDYKNYSTM